MLRPSLRDSVHFGTVHLPGFLSGLWGETHTQLGHLAVQRVVEEGVHFLLLGALSLQTGVCSRWKLRWRPLSWDLYQWSLGLLPKRLSRQGSGLGDWGLHVRDGYSSGSETQCVSDT